MTDNLQSGFFEYKQVQKRETEVTRKERPIYFYRYAYNRSAECMHNDDPGQDYLTSKDDGTRLVFVLCDGVSQSFFGDVAASFLGDKLVDWLWDKQSIDAREIETMLQQFWAALVREATERVAFTALEDGIPDMLRSVLEEKRASGSETMLVAGLVDFTQRKAILLSLGDMRLRVWDKNKNEITNELGLSPNTNERWSTLRGPIGTVHVKELPFDRFHSIAAYSDGLARLDKVPLFRLSDGMIQESIKLSLESPASDDISFFELRFGKAPPDPKRLIAPVAKVIDHKGAKALSWNKIPQATAYEILVRSAGQHRIRVAETSWVIPNELISAENHFQIRAWCEDEPGEWSESLPLGEIRPVEQPAETPQAEPFLTQAAPIFPPNIRQGPQLEPRERVRKDRPKKWNTWVWVPVLLVICGTAFFFSWDKIQPPQATPTPTATNTRKPTFPPRRTSTSTRSVTPSPSKTVTSTVTPSHTAIKTGTVTSSPSITPTTDETMTRTATASPTSTVTKMKTFTLTPSPTVTSTLTKTATPLPTPTIPNIVITPSATLIISPPIHPSPSVPPLP